MRERNRLEPTGRTLVMSAVVSVPISLIVYSSWRAALESVVNKMSFCIEHEAMWFLGHGQAGKATVEETHCPASLSAVTSFDFQSNGIVWFSWAVFTADGADCRRHQTESDEGLRLFSLSLLEPGNYFRKASWVITMRGEIHYVRCKLSRQLISITYFHIHKKLLTTETSMNGAEQRYYNTSFQVGSLYPLTVWLAV